MITGWWFGNVWNMAFMTFHHIANVIIPTDELHPFSEGLVETTNQDLLKSLQVDEWIEEVEAAPGAVWSDGSLEFTASSG